MSNLASQNDNQGSSPFDSIMHVDESGQEYWIARELMELLGYTQWRKFHASIKRALENIEANHHKAFEHCCPLRDSLRDSEQVDYELSRLACYHTTLACVGRGKPMVAQAKHYFAAKTREAEVVIPAQQEQLKEQQLEIRKLELQLQLANAQQKLIDTRNIITSTMPKDMADRILGVGKIVEYRDRTILPGGEVNDGVGITYIQRRYGFKNTKQAWAWLESLGYGKMTDKWNRALKAVDCHTLTREALAELDELWEDSQRQRFLGEQIRIDEL